MAEANRLLGVGGLNASGEITLNYIDPAARFQGVSSAMLDWLERHLRTAGRSECRLTSTVTAHAFYLSRGYADILGASGAAGGELAMVKAL